MFIGFIISAMILYILKKKSSGFFGTRVVEYSGRKFKVVDLEGNTKAAEILFTVDKDIVILKNYISEKYKNSDNELLRQIGRRASKYSSDSLIENYPDVPKKDVSYNLNKGETIALCLRDYKSPEVFHEYNEILFVALHELAHSLNCDESSFLCGDTYGHDDQFWLIFKIILQNAVDCGIYRKKNYKKEPVNYCSMDISYSPLYDASLKNLS